jgi:enoyl-CoA hydratase/carnithine racemase
MVTKIVYLNEGHETKKDANPLNPLSEAIRRKIFSSIREAIADSNVTSIILFGGGIHFSAGADIT